MRLCHIVLYLASCIGDSSALMWPVHLTDPPHLKCKEYKPSLQLYPLQKFSFTAGVYKTLDRSFNPILKPWMCCKACMEDDQCTATMFNHDTTNLLCSLINMPDPQNYLINDNTYESSIKIPSTPPPPGPVSTMHPAPFTGSPVPPGPPAPRPGPNKSQVAEPSGRKRTILYIALVIVGLLLLGIIIFTLSYVGNRNKKKHKKKKKDCKDKEEPVKSASAKLIMVQKEFTEEDESMVTAVPKPNNHKDIRDEMATCDTSSR